MSRVLLDNFLSSFSDSFNYIHITIKKGQNITKKNFTYIADDTHAYL